MEDPIRGLISAIHSYSMLKYVHDIEIKPTLFPYYVLLCFSFNRWRLYALTSLPEIPFVRPLRFRSCESCTRSSTRRSARARPPDLSETIDTQTLTNSWQWLWLSRIRHQRSVVRIQSLAKFYKFIGYQMHWKDKNKEKRGRKWSEQLAECSDTTDPRFEFSHGRISFAV